MSELVDRPRLTKTRARARADGMFLQELAADEIEDRLQLVNRRFTRPAIVTAFPNVWQGRMPDARIISDDELLDLRPGTHDLVIHALSLHWANDPVGQIAQCARALEADGLFIGAMFGGQTLHELRAVLAEVEVGATGGLSPRVLPMGEIRDLGNLIERGGLALPVADSTVRDVRYSSALALMRDLRLMGEGNALAQRAGFTSRTLFAEAAARYAETFGGDDGRVAATFEMIFLTGWAPDESQQKPLRPGSAAARLADALGADETKLPD